MSGLHACLHQLLDGGGVCGRDGWLLEAERQVTPLACPQLLLAQSKLKAVTAYFKLRVIRQILLFLLAG